MASPSASPLQSQRRLLSIICGGSHHTKLSLELLRSLKEQYDLEVNLLQDSLTKISCSVRGRMIFGIQPQPQQSLTAISCQHLWPQCNRNKALLPLPLLSLDLAHPTSADDACFNWSSSCTTSTVSSLIYRSCHLPLLSPDAPPTVATRKIPTVERLIFTVSLPKSFQFGSLSGVVIFETIELGELGNLGSNIYHFLLSAS
ncbi:hypothetical protein BHM03_00022687 [Ensete ventricosum]|nr:hypothetical protein BHM03_00022687 [Ensete ventricosum]